jgi:hypothetical protein
MFELEPMMTSSVYAWDPPDLGIVLSLAWPSYPWPVPRAIEWRSPGVGIGLLIAGIWSTRDTDRQLDSCSQRR